MNAIHFRVEGLPRPSADVGASVRRGRAHVYDKGTAEGWKQAVWAEALKHRPAKPIEGAVIIMMSFALPRPKTATRLRHDRKPDWENLVKPVQDVLTKLGYWSDDCQIDEASVSKYYADAEAGPGVTVDIQW